MHELECSLCSRRNVLCTVKQSALPPAGAARAIQNGSRELDPTASAQAFGAEWRERYGSAASTSGGSTAVAPEGPRWLECGWQEATNRATAEGKFLMVYLHAWQHQVGDALFQAMWCTVGVLVARSGSSL